MYASALGHLIISWFFFHMTRCFADANKQSSIISKNNQCNISAFVFRQREWIKNTTAHVHGIKFA